MDIDATRIARINVHSVEILILNVLAWRGCFSSTFLPSGTNPSYDNELMTLEYCGQMCSDDSGTHAAFGVMQTSCYCLADVHGAMQLSNRACDFKCPGDEAQMCGGKGSLIIHMLKNESFTDVLGMAGGSTHAFNVILHDGNECADHEIPKIEDRRYNGYTVIEDHTIVACGGIKERDGNDDVCKFYNRVIPV